MSLTYGSGKVATWRWSIFRDKKLWKYLNLNRIFKSLA